MEIQGINSATIPILKKFDLFWKGAILDLKLKIGVFHAVVVSKLVYGLDALQYTEAQGHTCNFHMKGLRTIL